ncbi:hypothetical protein BHE90_013773 [Fusarium euwallaceae]|uniref:Uncharacterized protein n=1 Tax=Fusarium euwallaceae TaxID=1147111 RepID=A0A430L7U6_9HYPO|nr:hypothetical protein BHE90_013773 [Fusarium euwallaceae]
MREYLPRFTLCPLRPGSCHEKFGAHTGYAIFRRTQDDTRFAAVIYLDYLQVSVIGAFLSIPIVTTATTTIQCCSIVLELAWNFVSRTLDCAQFSSLLHRYRNAVFPNTVHSFSSPSRICKYIAFALCICNPCTAYEAQQNTSSLCTSFVASPKRIDLRPASAV